MKEKKLYLYMVMLGCKPQGRLTEQHDIFFGIGETLDSLIPEMKDFWPEAKGQIHIDAWRKITVVDDFEISVVPKTTASQPKLFFVNLGGYKPMEFEEFHYKFLTVATTKAIAIKKAKDTTFYKHCGFTGATSHIDDKYGIDVDDIFNIEDVLPAVTTSQYSLSIQPAKAPKNDTLYIGYKKIPR